MRSLRCACSRSFDSLSSLSTVIDSRLLWSSFIFSRSLACGARRAASQHQRPAHDGRSPREVGCISLENASAASRRFNSHQSRAGRLRLGDLRNEAIIELRYLHKYQEQGLTIVTQHPSSPYPIPILTLYPTPLLTLPRTPPHPYTPPHPNLHPPHPTPHPSSPYPTSLLTLPHIPPHPTPHLSSPTPHPTLSRPHPLTRFSSACNSSSCSWRVSTCTCAEPCFSAA